MSAPRIRAVDRQDVSDRTYLGDGLYAAFDGYGIWVTAEDGIQATDAVYFEPDVLDKLVSFYGRARRSEPKATPL